MTRDYTFKAPKFDGTNIAYWRERMKYHLATMLVEIWESIKKGYNAPQNGPTTIDEIKTYESDAKDTIAIVTCLNDAIFSKVIEVKLAKEIWEKLKSLCEGDEKTKQAKLINLKHKFGNVRMCEDKNTEGYIHQVNEIVNSLRGVGGMVEESKFVRKIMETFPKSYKPKKYVIEESHDMNKYIMDYLLRSLTAFEVVELDDIKKERRETTFKGTKKLE
ncbi:uncharacterized protein LOC131858475 [Cryptomeria japonica]|uniref:uncharacterized protein LOC131858475 n=1 Tax=Cryptomeria japonica TaxID=3369 RepID=UPI0027D9F414|nr:uncharacterized protein LOC131858475 [Cryptomeria japonica]